MSGVEGQTKGGNGKGWDGKVKEDGEGEKVSPLLVKVTPMALTSNVLVKRPFSHLSRCRWNGRRCIIKPRFKVNNFVETFLFTQPRDCNRNKHKTKFKYLKYRVQERKSEIMSSILSFYIVRLRSL